MSLQDVWITPLPKQASRLWGFSSSCVLFFVTACSKTWLGLLNKPTVHGRRALYDALDHRPSHKPLITVCNHPSMIDDTLLSYMLRWSDVFKRSSVRWLPGAKDVCCRTWQTNLFFQLGRVLPVERGGGVYQQGMDFCVERMREGEWVHMYPEGKVNSKNEFIRFKWGIGRLIADSEVCPMILPYYHVGMGEVLPTLKPYRLRTGKRVTVIFGEPMDFEQDLKTLKEQNKNSEEIRKYITDKIQEEFAVLKERAEKKHREVEVYSQQGGKVIKS